MKRKMPKDADYYAWHAFEAWCDANGIGDHKDDWEMNWDCWKAAYIKAKND